jgi:glycosyltransferase involved in cell wall biosynthesis
MSVVNYDIKLPNSIKKASNQGIDVTLLLVGQITSNKGQMDAAKALVLLKKRGYNIHLLFIGQISDSTYGAELKHFIGANDLVNSISFISHTDSPYDYVTDFTIGLMCSEWEALGRVTIEYMKLGIPVIGAKSSTTQKLITHKVNGLLYDLRNANDLAACITELIVDPELRERIEANAVVYANTNFNTEKFIAGITKHL